MRETAQRKTFCKAHCFYIIVRSLRNNIGEHTLHANIDLDLQETWLISKRETAEKEEA